MRFFISLTLSNGDSLQLDLRNYTKRRDIEEEWWRGIEENNQDTVSLFTDYDATLFDSLTGFLTTTLIKNALKRNWREFEDKLKNRSPLSCITPCIGGYDVDEGACCSRWRVIVIVEVVGTMSCCCCCCCCTIWSMHPPSSVRTIGDVGLECFWNIVIIIRIFCGTMLLRELAHRLILDFCCLDFHTTEYSPSMIFHATD